MRHIPPDWIDFEASVRERVKEIAYAHLNSYGGWVCRHFNLLPTDERFLRLRPWECERLYWEEALARRAAERDKKGLPANSLKDLLQEESFEAELAALDEKLAAEEAERRPVSLPEVPAEPPERVIRFRADEAAAGEPRSE